MSLIAIQLLLLSVNRTNSRGAKGRKSWGLLQPSSHITLTIADVTLGSSLSSFNLSVILGQAGRRVSGYTSASLYKVTTVFFLIADWEWVKRARISERSEFAIVGLITCGTAVSGNDIVGGEGDDKSCQMISTVSILLLKFLPFSTSFLPVTALLYLAWSFAQLQGILLFSVNISVRTSPRGH